MTSIEERLVDLLLEEAIGGARVPDVLPRILAARRRRALARAAGIALLLALASAAAILAWRATHARAPAIPPNEGTSPNAPPRSPPDAPLTTAELARIDELLTSVATPAASLDENDPAYFDRLKALDQATDALDRELTTRAAVRDRCRQRLVELSAPGHDDDVRARSVRLLLADPAADARVAVGAALTDAPELFLPDDLLAAAEAGVDAALPPLRRFALEDPPNGSRAAAGLFLARRGEREVAPRLRRLLERDLTEAVSRDEQLCAAVGLAELGDAQFLREAKAAIAAAIEQRLGRDELELARVELLRAEYLLTRAEDGSPRPLDQLSTRLSEHVDANAAALADAEAIRDRARTLLR
jgi:hypothetical protein